MKKNKKRKFLKLLIIIITLVLLVLYLYNLRVKNIYVKGNTLLSDYEIIELSGLNNYPRMFSKTSINIENKIKISPYIKSVNVKKDLFGKVVIEIEEFDILLKDSTDNKIYLSNLKKIAIDDKLYGIPSLINYVDRDILNNFLKKLNTIDKSVLSKISEIEYTLNEYDKDLFLFYMNDGNYVYITTTRLLNINSYSSVLENLEGKKGILYLDSGNHFEILQ